MKLVWMSSIEAVVEKFVISYKYKFCPMFQNIYISAITSKFQSAPRIKWAMEKHGNN